MKYYHIFNHSSLFNKEKKSLAKYAWFYFFLKFTYPIWVLLGIIFTGNIIFLILVSLGIIRYSMYPFFRNNYPIYELTETVISIILILLLLF